MELESLVTHLEEENARLMHEEVLFLKFCISCIYDCVGSIESDHLFYCLVVMIGKIKKIICMGMVRLGLYKQENGGFCISVA